MAKNKGKPSGNDASNKRDIGRKGDYQRTGWPEDAPTQHVSSADEEPDLVGIPGEGDGRDSKAGGPF